MPKDLVELEADVGESERPLPGLGAGAPSVHALLRACAAAATLSSEAAGVGQILGEMRNSSGARAVVLVCLEGEAHRASVLARDALEPGQRLADWLRQRPRLLARAQQALLPLSSDDLQDEENAAPFYVTPLEMRERRLGCVCLEWPRGVPLPGEDVRRVLQSMAQLVALVLEREALRPGATTAANVLDPAIIVIGGGLAAAFAAIRQRRTGPKGWSRSARV